MAYEFFSDEMLAIYVPILLYWIASGIYELIAYLRPDALLHPKEEEKQKNIGHSRSRVTKFVLFQQAMQIVLLTFFQKITGGGRGVPRPQPPLPVLALQFFVAMVVYDIMQYFFHRLTHASKFMYNRLHWVHHALLVPHATGSQYSHPLEGIPADIVFGLLICGLTGMTDRTTMCFFSLVTVKFVDLHSGLWLPWSPFNLLFSNTSAFHDTHHQLKGFRYNYSTPFFLFGDKIFGTYMPFTVEKRMGGGYEARMMIKDS